MKSQRVIGTIGPCVDITETPAFTGPSKVLFVEDGQGTLHGSIQWLAFEVDADFLRAFEQFATHALKREPSRGIGA